MQWAPRANTNTVVPAVGRRQTDPNGNADAPAEAAALMDIYRRWIDAEKLAGATARIALSGPVAALQELKRQVIALPIPPCLAEAKTSLVSLIVKSADAHLEFMLKNELASMLYNLVDREKAIGSFEGALSLARCGR